MLMAKLGCVIETSFPSGYAAQSSKLGTSHSDIIQDDSILPQLGNNRGLEIQPSNQQYHRLERSRKHLTDSR